ncbi:hypothetical protein A2160_02790 [Candidatus Beckwithbacteria bacterium RBG_13_42_9]|uniref:Glycosyl transferase family 1 n=1 Tax=Candidatus Beckwithbacteria bacterium RBG_13_42_9 TaxID=1797457 RepID=A0A1F5E7P3_9BACT|nr:MAG: hypothetical protein A2160_02790 [Candidatus Beckwithbacteria bacterium RBG_13_42_9]
MRILTIQASYFPMIGGAEIFHQKTAEWMVKQRHQVDVVTCIWDKPDVKRKSWKRNQEIISGVSIFRVKPWFYIHYLKSIGSIWPLYCQSLQLIKLKKYDLIHAHIFPASIVGALLKKATGLPLIITVQGGDMADYAETGSNFSFFIKPIISRALKKADLVHTVSDQLKRDVKKIGAMNIRVIPNGVDSLLFKPRNKIKLRKVLGLESGKFIIISHSRLTPKNGLDILIKAISRSKSKENVLLLLVGNGEQESDLRRLTNQLCLQKQVRFYGYQPKEMVAKLLATADIFVRPSRQEGFGISFLEAMASGIPVIGTEIGGITDFIKDGQNGLLIKKAVVGELINKIEYLQANKNLQQVLGKNSRLTAQKYSWSKICSHIESQYQSILNKNMYGK